MHRGFSATRKNLRLNNSGKPVEKKSEKRNATRILNGEAEALLTLQSSLCKKVSQKTGPASRKSTRAVLVAPFMSLSPTLWLPEDDGANRPRKVPSDISYIHTVKNNKRVFSLSSSSTKLSFPENTEKTVRVGMTGHSCLVEGPSANLYADIIEPGKRIILVESEMGFHSAFCSRQSMFCSMCGQDFSTERKALEHFGAKPKGQRIFCFELKPSGALVRFFLSDYRTKAKCPSSETRLKRMNDFLQISAKEKKPRFDLLFSLDPEELRRRLSSLKQITR